MSAGARLFLYGTLCDAALLEIVAGEALAVEAARLEGHAVFWVAGESFPVIAEVPGGVAKGLVITPDEAARARLDFYELGFGYGVETRVVGGLEAAVYMPEPERWPVGARWSMADWQAAHGALAREAAVEYMRLFETHAPEDAARAFPMIRSRAASRLRARAEPSPEAFDGAPGAVVTQKTRQPYTDYFAVREDWLRIPAFGGGYSETVKRASFMGGDAVTVLPYDPSTGRVLAIRQFRHGAFVRGDANPWCLEPPAGRIDPGETAEEAARRELREETGLEPQALYQVAAYYPTPGAYSEHLTNFVALCDLTGRDGQVMGEATEHENIMSHVMTLEDLMAMIETGAANTGPLVTSAQWLMLNRDRLH